ncbi:MAG TPA: acylphosphatase [Caulobacteraceae bacterium]|nr:acylphosphatase [Caulobacteraceae bacterium]
MARTAVRMLVEGRVQGVGYRWWALDRAQTLGLAGWVRNRKDGSVELLAIGEPDAIVRLADLCAKGPPSAIVLRVSQQPSQDDGSSSFSQLPTL